MPTFRAWWIRTASPSLLPSGRECGPSIFPLLSDRHRRGVYLCRAAGWSLHGLDLLTSSCQSPCRLCLSMLSTLSITATRFVSFCQVEIDFLTSVVASTKRWRVLGLRVWDTQHRQGDWCWTRTSFLSLTDVLCPPNLGDLAWRCHSLNCVVCLLLHLLCPRFKHLLHQNLLPRGKAADSRCKERWL